MVEKKKKTSLNPSAAVWKPPSINSSTSSGTAAPSTTVPTQESSEGNVKNKVVSEAPAVSSVTKTAASVVIAGGKGGGDARSKVLAPSTTNKQPTSSSSSSLVIVPAPSAWSKKGGVTGTKTTTTTTSGPSSNASSTTQPQQQQQQQRTSTSSVPPVTGWGNKNVMAAIKAAPTPPPGVVVGGGRIPPMTQQSHAAASSGGGRRQQQQQQQQQQLQRGGGGNRNQHQQKQQQQQRQPRSNQGQQQQQNYQSTANKKNYNNGSNGSAWGNGSKNTKVVSPTSNNAAAAAAATSPSGSTTTATTPAGTALGENIGKSSTAPAPGSTPVVPAAAATTTPAPAPTATTAVGNWSKVAAKKVAPPPPAAAAPPPVVDKVTKKGGNDSCSSAASVTGGNTKPQSQRNSHHQNQNQNQQQQQHHKNKHQNHHHHHHGQQGHGHHGNHHSNHHNHHHYHKKEHGKRMEVTDATLFTSTDQQTPTKGSEETATNNNDKQQDGSSSDNVTASDNTKVVVEVTRFTSDDLLNLRKLFLNPTTDTSSSVNTPDKDNYKEWIWDSITRIEDITRQMNHPKSNKPYVYGHDNDDTKQQGGQPQLRLNKDGILVAPKGELVRKENSNDPNIYINEHGEEIYVKPLEVNDEIRWKPKVAANTNANGEENNAKKEEGEGEEEKELDEDEILKQALALLNKLTPTTFPKLAPLFVEQIIQTQSLLSEGLKLLISKAQQEPHFCPMYAQVCSTIAYTALPFALNEKKQGRTLKKLLLEECQHEFDSSQEEKVAKALETLPDPTDEEERKYRKQLVKRNYLGHMTFIGEIYKVDLASIKVMLMCLPILLTGDRTITDSLDISKEHFKDVENVDEEAVECFAKLMTTIGHRLEDEAITLEQNNKPEHMEKLNALWNRVHHLVHNKDSSELCSNRIKFMLLDLIELRDNGWTARRKTETAKTLQDIRLEAELEMSPAQPPRGSLHRGTSSGSIRSMASAASAAAAPTTVVDKDGFTTIINKTTKLPRSMSQGALRRSQSGGKLGGGGGGGGNNKQQQHQQQQSHPQFRRSTSSDVGMMAGGISPGFIKSPSRTITPRGSRSDLNSKDYNKGFSALQDSLPFDTIIETKTIATPKSTVSPFNENNHKHHTQASDGGGENSITSCTTTTTTNNSSTVDLTKCEKKVKAILKEYLSNHDLKDAILSLKEVILPHQSDNQQEQQSSTNTTNNEQQQLGSKCIETILFVLMESSKAQVDKCTPLWKELLVSIPLTSNMILSGIRDPFEFVQDIMIDAPMARTILLDLISMIITSTTSKDLLMKDDDDDDTSIISFMTKLPEEFVLHGKSAEFAINLMKLSHITQPSDSDLNVIDELMTLEEKKQYGSAIEFVNKEIKNST